MNGYNGSRGIAPLILFLDTRWALSSGKNSGTHSAGIWVGPRAALDVWQRIQIYKRLNLITCREWNATFKITYLDLVHHPRSYYEHHKVLYINLAQCKPTNAHNSSESQYGNCYTFRTHHHGVHSWIKHSFNILSPPVRSRTVVCSSVCHI